MVQLFLGLVEVTLPSWGIGYMSFLEGRGGAVRAKLHSSKSDLRTGLHDSASGWGAGVPDYFEKMNRGEAPDTWMDLPSSPVSPPSPYCGLASDYSCWLFVGCLEIGGPRAGPAFPSPQLLCTKDSFLYPFLPRPHCLGLHSPEHSWILGKGI